MTEDSEIKTYFKLSDLVKWLGLSQFEILINLIAFFIFTILLTVIHPNVNDNLRDWFIVFSPLFCGNILNAYFSIIVCIRLYLANCHRQALNRMLWSVKFIVLTTVFKYLLCLRLADETQLTYSEVFAPIFVLLILLSLRACQYKQQS